MAVYSAKNLFNCIQVSRYCPAVPGRGVGVNRRHGNESCATFRVNSSFA